MWECRRAQDADFEQMVELQNAHHDGFLHTIFTAQDFKQMDKSLCVVVAVELGKVCAYLCTTQVNFHTTPLWREMISHSSAQGERFFLAGPICINPLYRSSGVYQALCAKVLEIIPKGYQLALGFIDVQNERHLHASQKVGLQIQGGFEFKGHAYHIVALKII